MDTVTAPSKTALWTTDEADALIDTLNDYKSNHTSEYEVLVKALKVYSQKQPINATDPSTVPQPSTIAPAKSVSALPTIDTIDKEKAALIKSKVAIRIEQLQLLLQSLADGPERTKRLIELKSLQQLDKQKQLRAQIASEIHKVSSRLTTSDRRVYKRYRQFYLPPELVPISEKQERQKRDEGSNSKKAKHRLFVASIINHSKMFAEYHSARVQDKKRVLKQLAKHFANKEKREQTQKERLEKERIMALRRNDEASYIKLVEEAKNTRLKHIIEQTDKYLQTIAAKIEQIQQINKMLEAKKKKESGVEETADDLVLPQTIEAGANSYYSRIHNVSEQVKAQPTILVGGKLKEYQIDGLNWLASLYNNEVNGILADEMGLGKTIQTISLVCFLMESKGEPGPFLVVAPLTTLSNWSMEFDKWAPSVVKVVYKGMPQTRKKLFHDRLASGRFNVCLTTYEYIVRDKSTLGKLKWVYTIVDEGHRMKNHNSKLSATLSSHYNPRYRLLLTGTPLQNNLPELWSLLNFLLPGIFNSVDDFEQWFNKPFANTGEKVEMNEEETMLVINRLHKLLRPFLLRRLKRQVEGQLPQKREKVLRCAASAWQKRLQDQITQGAVAVLKSDGQQSTSALRNSLAQLRKACNHPYLFNVDRDWAMDNNLWRTSGKFELLDKILPKLQAGGHRVLMFSQMTNVLTLMEDYFVFRGYKYLRLDGNTKSEDRGDLLLKFNAKDSPYFIFILSTRAGGLGLNLQTADTVILFDSDWNPQMDLQAQDRAHRIGQENEVLVIRMITINSIEEKILERANFKLDMDSKVIEAGMFNKHSNASDRREFLVNLLQKNDDDETDNEVPDGKQLNQMIARSEEEYHMFQKMDKEQLERERTEWEAKGNRGIPMPPRLIEDSELPDWLKVDVAQMKEAKAQSLMTDYGRGRRQRGAQVSYNDDLSDAAFAELVEGQEEEADRQRALAKTANSLRLYKPDSTHNPYRGVFELVWKKVHELRDEHQRLRAFEFLELPPRDLYPDYYLHITNPISLNMMREQFRIPTYMPRNFWDDLELMVANAKHFNMAESMIYKDAVEIEREFKREYRQFFDEEHQLLQATLGSGTEQVVEVEDLETAQKRIKLEESADLEMQETFPGMMDEDDLMIE